MGKQASFAWLEADNVREFNDWREAHPNAVIDLSQARLKDADLRGANLKDANLRGADLEGADLREAKLMGANLTGANTKGAKFTGASYAFAAMTRAQLDSIEDENRSTVHLID